MENTSVHHDISYIWTRLHPRWLATGLIAGLGAGLIMLCLAAYLSTTIHEDLTFPVKLIGSSLSAGFLIHFSLAGFFGVVFSQFVSENSRKRSLLLLSFLGGLAVWLFWFAMFMPSFNEAMTFFLPKKISLLLHVVFGLSFGLLVVWIRPFLCKK